jgi:hypothetical protein
MNTRDEPEQRSQESPSRCKEVVSRDDASVSPPAPLAAEREFFRPREELRFLTVSLYGREDPRIDASTRLAIGSTRLSASDRSGTHRENCVYFPLNPRSYVKSLTCSNASTSETVTCKCTSDGLEQIVLHRIRAFYRHTLWAVNYPQNSHGAQIYRVEDQKEKSHANTHVLYCLDNADFVDMHVRKGARDCFQHTTEV